MQLTMLVRGFPGTNIADINVQPNLLKWSPYIGRNTRRGPLLINTEHRKVSGSDQRKLEKECRDITEKRLVEFLTQSTALEVKKINLGISEKGSKFDIVFRIKQCISKDTEKFNKVFGNVWSCSGGWVFGCCNHGIVYVLKFVLRAESPRDYVDLLLSMKFQPNVTIIDMANMVAAHGNKRQRTWHVSSA